MKKALAIAKTNLLEIKIDLKSHGIVFILPMVFMLIFGFLFSQTLENQTFRIATIKTDNVQYLETISILESIKLEDEELMFDLHEHKSEKEAKECVKAGDSDIAIVLGKELPFKIFINESSQKSAIARSVVKEILLPQEQQLFETESVITKKNISGFEMQSGGLIIYGILIIIPQIAGTLASLKDKKYIFRYNSSKVTSFDIIGGFTISSFVVGIIQTIFLFYVASWFGLTPSIYTLQALIFIIPTILFAIGTGLIIGTIAPKSSTAQDIGTIFSIILGFLSGSFIMGIEMVGFNIGEKFFSITTVVPTFYAYKGVTQLIVFNKPISSLITELLVISIVSLALFVIGAFTWKFKNK